MDSFRETPILYAECGPFQKVRMAPEYEVVSFYKGGPFHKLVSGRSILGNSGKFLGKGRGFPGIGPPLTR